MILYDDQNVGSAVNYVFPTIYSRTDSGNTYTERLLKSREIIVNEYRNHVLYNDLFKYVTELLGERECI